jgi:hypothetical protein
MVEPPPFLLEGHLQLELAFRREYVIFAIQNLHIFLEFGTCGL